jgi:hypothetical protein
MKARTSFPTAAVAAPLATDRTARPGPLTRWVPLTGIAFAVFFLASVALSSPPKTSASNAAWIANYTGSSHRAGHIATGICLILAGLSLLTFMTALWRRIAEASRPRVLSSLPVLAAGVAAACMSIGGVLMAGAITVVHTGVTPDANLLRLCNSLGFLMVALGGMLAAALSVAGITLQARSVGYLGRKLSMFGLATAVVLLGSIAFIPIAALVIWLVVTAVTLLRMPDEPT